LAERYRTRLTGIEGLTLPVEREGGRHVYHLFVIRCHRRDELRAWLTEQGVETGIHYPIALPRLAAYAEHAQHGDPFLGAVMADQVLSLPMGDSIRLDEVDRVCRAIETFPW
jgi:dTDP-4-amino-4,6-dideoxygalactose transaminase